jgi:CRISPR-associated protein Csm2
MTITEKNYVDKAEKAILSLKNMKNEKNGRPIQMVTTSKLRNLLAMTSDIYNDVLNSESDALDDETCGRIDYLKVRFLYEVGRDTERKVKAFVEQAEIVQCINEINGSRKNFILFNRYMEALIAYHKFYGGKDN